MSAPRCRAQSNRIRTQLAGIGRIARCAAVAALLAASCHAPAHAEFINGAFETGSLSGWTVEFTSVSLNLTNGKREFGTWTSTPPANHPGARVLDGTQAAIPTLAGLMPYCDGFMAQINDHLSGHHATRIRQTIDLASLESNCSQIKVRWGALLGVGPGHSDQQQAYFTIVINVNGEEVVSFAANANDATAANGWTCGAGTEGSLCYKSGTFLHQLGDVDAGDDVEVFMTVADCTDGGHGGTAFLDCTTIDAPCGRPCSPDNTAGIPQPTISNVFTPNGDGINDVTRVFHLNQACYLKYQVFNVWGVKLFEDEANLPLGYVDGSYSGWNGKIDGTGADVPEGTYYYVVTAKNCVDTQVWTGHMSLFR